MVLSLSLLTALLLPCDPQPAPAAPVCVGFELTKTRHIVVEVKANGRGPYRMVFDTGAPFVIMSQRMARETGVVTDDKGLRASPFGGMGQFTVGRLSLGEASADDVSAVVMDHPTVVLMSRYAGPLDGIVGFPFFARFRTSIDYQAKELTLQPSRYRPSDLVRELTAIFSGQTPRKRPEPVAPAGLWGLEVARTDEDEKPGVPVIQVAENGPAAAAGLRLGDRILMINGCWTDSVRDTFEAVAAVAPGVAVPVTVRRGERELRLQVTPRLGF